MNRKIARGCAGKELAGETSKKKTASVDAGEVPGRKTYTIGETGRILGLGRNGAYDAARRGEIPTIRIGRRLLVPRAALLRLLGEQAVAQGGDDVLG